MCGIAGLIGKNRPVSLDEILPMVECLENRGPDHSSTWLSKNNKIALGHTRLSIIDCSENSHQPLHYRDRFVITYNGEVYNYAILRRKLISLGHEFYSGGDTEVIVASYAEWGSECVNHFDGMFAFAIFDKVTNSVFIARDTVGIKPLYIYEDKNMIAFASTTKAISNCQNVKLEINPTSILQFIEIGFIPAPRSPFKQIRKVEPGNWVLFDLNSHGICSNSGAVYKSQQKYKKGFNFNKSKSALKIAIEQSVTSQLNADVRVGTFLSGGIDSSLITAIAQKHSAEKIDTFTLSFPGSAEDELQHARDIAKQLGCNNYFVEFTPENLIDRLEFHATEFDEPFGDPSALPTFDLCKLASKHVKVCLGGDGADELFGGYKNYRYLNFLSAFSKAPVFLKKIIQTTLGFNPISNPRLELLKKALSCESDSEIYYLMRSMTKDAPVFKQTRDSNTFRHIVNSAFEDSLLSSPSATAAKLDMQTYLPDDILKKVDVTSMAFSIEARVPFLSNEVRALAQSFPETYKLNIFQSKLILREMLADYLPKAMFNRPKQGFDLPLNKWLATDLKDFMVETLSKKNISTIEILDYDLVEKLVSQHVSNQRNWAPILWNLISLITWYKKHA